MCERNIKHNITNSVFKRNWLLCCRCIGSKANYLNIIWKLVFSLNCVNTNRQLFFLSNRNVMYIKWNILFLALFTYFIAVLHEKYHTITYIIIVLIITNIFNSLLKLTLTAPPKNTSAIKHPIQSLNSTLKP